MMNSVIKTDLRLSFFVVILLGLIYQPSPIFAFVDMENENGAFTARGAVDLYAGFTNNPQIKQIYPTENEAFGGSSFRLLLDGYIGEHLRLQLNGFQKLQSVSDSKLNIKFDEPYRTSIFGYDFLKGEKGKAPIGLDQLSIKIFTDIVDITIGRQPTGLANNFIFTPNDFFYPFSSAEIDREFRAGVDALRLDIRSGMLSQITLIGALGYDNAGIPAWKQSAAILKASYNANGFDWTVLGGKLDGRYIAGMAFSGEAGVLGIRSEGNISFPDKGDVYINFAGGIDHRWENTLHLMLEYYYHGGGKKDVSEYLDYVSKPEAIFDPFLGQQYIGVSLSGEATPLLIVQGTILANLSDMSFFLSPSLKYSASDELEFILSAAFPFGKKPGLERIEGSSIKMPKIRSEYGFYPINIMLQGRLYF